VASKRADRGHDVDQARNREREGTGQQRAGKSRKHAPKLSSGHMVVELQTSVTELPESRVRVRAEVPAAELDRSMQRAARALGRDLRLPGFRKGKVPPPVVIRRLGREAVFDEALRTSIGDWYTSALDRSGVVPVGEPELDVGEIPEAGEPLSFSIEIGVRPRAKLGKYKGLEVGRREPDVTDEVIDAELERLRDGLATLETVDRPAEQGDHVVIDYVGSIDGELFEGGAGRDQLLELGSGRLIPGFEQQLLGAVAGETRGVDVTFPSDYSEQLAGKSAHFDVTVTEVKGKRLPVLDDEFATEAAGLDTLDELREDIAQRAREVEAHNIEHEFERAVLDAAVAESEVEIPERLVHARAHELVQETIRALARQGVSEEGYRRITGMDEEQLVHEAEPSAEQGLKRDAVLAAIVEAEQIEPTDEDVLEALEGSAGDQDAAAKLIERLRVGGRLERMRDEVASRKANELIVAHARPISVEQAQARDKLWTPGKEDDPQRPGKLWTPST
jgi:trigger factor